MNTSLNEYRDSLPEYEIQVQQVQAEQQNQAEQQKPQQLKKSQQQQQQQHQQIVSLKWTCEGCEPPQRSQRVRKRTPYIPNDDTLVDPHFIKELETSAYSNALNHDEYTWNMLNNSLANKGF